MEHNQPMVEVLSGITAISVYHFTGDTSAQEALAAHGLDWPEQAGKFAGAGPWVARRNPQELLVVGAQQAVPGGILESLSAGCSASALAVDHSEAVVVFEMRGPSLSAWLAHLVDASALPEAPGQASRCRLVDVPVWLLRLETERVWLMADRAIAPYISNWLSYSHEGAFGPVC